MLVTDKAIRDYSTESQRGAVRICRAKVAHYQATRMQFCYRLTLGTTRIGLEVIHISLRREHTAMHYENEIASIMM